MRWALVLCAMVAACEGYRVDYLTECDRATRDCRRFRQAVVMALGSGTTKGIGGGALHDADMVTPGTPVDPWGRPYHLVYTSGSREDFLIFSLGPDGVVSSDDIDERTRCARPTGCARM